MAPKRILVIDDSPTILKVVELTLTRGGFTVTTATDGEAGLATARSAPPDLILLDFVMPKMNGYQVVRALAEDPRMQKIPVILMSAKGDQVGERFVKVLGIVDYITKPFSPEAITAVVAHTLEKYAQGTGGSGLLSTAPAEDPAEAEAAAAAAPQPPAVQADPRRIAISLLRQAIGEAVTEVLRKRTIDAGSLPSESAQLTELVESSLDDERLDKLVTDVEASSPLGPDASVLTGDLRVVPIAEVLQLLQLQSQTGILAIHRPPSRVEVFFRGGKVDLASGTGLAEEFLLGRFIIENELMSRQDLELMLKSRHTRKLLGGQLVKLGYITDEDLKRAIAQQTCEIIYEVLRWKFGRFSFRSTRELPAAAVDAQLGLTVDGILMEGFRRVDEWHLIEREVDNFDIVFVRNEDAVAQMGRGRLTREELSVLELVNGKSTVKDIVKLSRMSSFDVSKMLYRLLSIKLLRKRVLPVAV